MDHLIRGYLQLGLVTLVFGGLQVWWISSVFRRRDLARPLSEGEFKKTLERIWGTRLCCQPDGAADQRHLVRPGMSNYTYCWRLGSDII